MIHPHSIRRHRGPRPRAFITLVLLATVIICGFVSFQARSQHAPANPTTSTASAVDDATLISAIDALVEKALEKRGAVGFSVAVARGGKVILAKGYGLADVELHVPANADTEFRIGSVTKQFTAAAIMRLVEQQKLSLADDITKYIKDFPTQGHTVTVRHLLNHTSGIPSYTDLGEEWARMRPLELTHEQLLALVKDKPFDFAPGEQWKYNNTAYYMLGMIIEEISGKTYADYVMEEFFKPLGLEHTRYDTNAAIVPGRAQGYSMSKGVLVNDEPLGMSQPFSAGSLMSTAGDLVKWQFALHAHDGKVVSSDSYKQMTTPTILDSGRNTEYGFGLGIDQWEGHQRISHGGGINGFTSFLAYYPDDALHIALISNSEAANPGPLVRSITRAALGIPETQVKDLVLTHDQSRPFLGSFVINDRLPIVFTEEDGKVHGQAQGQPKIALLYQGNGEFRASFDHEVKMVFDLPADGSPVVSFTLFQGGAEMKAVRTKESAESKPDKTTP